MAQDGHPYLTEVFDETRTRQRRILREIPAPLVQPQRMLGTARYQDPLLETLVRHEADDLCARNPELVAELEAMAMSTRSSELVAYLETRGVRGPKDPMADIARRAHDAEQSSHHESLPAELSRDFTALLNLLIWADWIAGDYTDPRVAAWTA